MDQDVQIQYLTSKHISALVSSILPAVEHFLLYTLSMTFDPIDWQLALRMCIMILVNFANVEHELNQYTDAVLDIQAHITMDVKDLSAAEQSTLLLNKTWCPWSTCTAGMCTNTHFKPLRRLQRWGKGFTWHKTPPHQFYSHDMIKPWTPNLLSKTVNSALGTEQWRLRYPHL